MLIQKYIEDVKKLHASGEASEHSYRPALQTCLSGFLKNVQVTNEPRRQLFGAPDYILKRGDITVGWIEAKDTGKDLDRVEKGSKDDDQWKRYTDAQPNIVLTDYLEFRFFTDGVKNETIRIGEIQNGKVVAIPENFTRFETLFKDFAAFQGQTIKSSKKLAEMMAHKAALMRDVFFKVVSDDGPSTLKDQLTAFKEVLMHNMDEAQFADVYAQTVAYGLFTARLHDTTLGDFNRGEALTLIPKTNPFLQKLFHYVAGSEIDNRVIWIVDALCEVYRAADLKMILKDFGASTGRKDPILHFYETFLAEYDPKLREVRGVYYTPEPVVQFIVRAVDDVLKQHFGLRDGLADSSKISITVDSDVVKGGKRQKEQKSVHKVQILDVATGTGTFLAEIVKQIYAKPGFHGQQGIWGDYVENDLLPRLHGFELLIASYAMCHMKLDLLLKETGYDSARASKRLGVYLTNSLEEHHKDSHLPFANWLSSEANEASRIKRDMPIMIAIGNPPYSGISQNMNSWIAQHKIEDYKYVDGVHFNERKHWLNNDYVQFIRLGEYYIERNGEGVLAYITDHSYLMGPTFRGMRWHLLNTFDDIYILDLHGNSIIKETAPDGSADMNVFDIRQGTAIILAVKKKQKNKKTLANVFHANMFGKRDDKYTFLNESTLKSIAWCKLDYAEPFYFFSKNSNSFGNEYSEGFALGELFPIGSTGIQSSRDGLVIGDSWQEVNHKISSFLRNEQSTRNYYENSSFWNELTARQEILKLEDWNEKITTYSYRPFDNQFIFFDDSLVHRTKMKIMSHLQNRENIALIVGRQGQVVGDMQWNLCFLSSTISDLNVFYRGGGFVFPLYVYQSIMGGVEQKTPNLDPKIYAAIKKIVPHITPENLFDYIYAVLHSPAYRKRYAEFLKSDFPRIPYPASAQIFDALARLGGEIRALHLMESPALDDVMTTYPVAGDHAVKAIRREGDKVFINENQYFGGVPDDAWHFYIGGYQPAQKWLKDRKGRCLTRADITHYQRIIVALAQTHRLMQAIDDINFLPDSKSGSE